jgi:hypothetical protein
MKGISKRCERSCFFLRNGSTSFGPHKHLSDVILFKKCSVYFIKSVVENLFESVRFGTVLFQASATFALTRTDQMEVEGKPISVAVSNPPERKNVTSLLSDKGEPLVSVALGGGSTIDKSDFGS